jgi:hypothetical protein
MAMIVGSVLVTRVTAPPPPPDDNGGGRPLGVCGGKVGIQPFLATGERVSYCDVSNADNS